MASINLGRVGFVLRGEWNSGATYKPLDVVLYNGTSYAARLVNSGLAPSTASDAWQELTQIEDAVSSGIAAKAVRYDTIQDLNGEQKTTARSNIEAASVASVATIQSSVSDLSSRVNIAEGHVEDLSSRMDATEADVEDLSPRMTDAENAIDDTQAMVALIEPSNPASMNHPTGSYFIYNGTLYRATTDIYAGNTITPSTNCEAAVLGNDLQLTAQWSVKKPVTAPNGTAGQILQTNGDGTTTWIDQETPIRKINSRIKKWNIDTNGKILFLGNSYGSYFDGETQLWGPDSNRWSLWPDVVAALLDIGAEGVNWWNLCAAGHSLNNIDTTKRFKTDFETWANDANNSSELANIGAVVCVAGLNDSDASRYAEIQNRMSELQYSVQTKCPYAKIYYGYTGFINVRTCQHPLGRDAEWRYAAMREYQQCESYKGIYLSGVENIFHCKDYMYADGIHPNAAGSIYLGRGIVNALLQGYAPYNGNAKVNIAANAYSTAYFGSGNGHIMQDVNDGILVNRVRFGLTYDENHYPTWQIGHEYDIGTVTLPYTNSQVLGDFTAECITDDGVGVIAYIRSQIISAYNGDTSAAYNDKLYFKIQGFSDGASTHTIKEMRQISFDATKYLQLEEEITIEQETVTIDSPIATEQETLTYLGIQ